MTARLDAHVLVVGRTDLTLLESRTHLHVDLVLLRGHLQTTGDAGRCRNTNTGYVM